MALFGLSPLVLSAIATSYFTDPITGLLNISRYMTFLAFLTVFVYIFSAFVLHYAGSPMLTVGAEFNIRTAEGVGPGETTPLLASDLGFTTVPHPSKLDHTKSELMKTVDFWLLVTFCILTLGVVCTPISRFFDCRLLFIT